MPQANGLQFTARVGGLPSDIFSLVGFTLTLGVIHLLPGLTLLALIAGYFRIAHHPASRHQALHRCGQRIRSGRCWPPAYPL